MFATIIVVANTHWSYLHLAQNISSSLLDEELQPSMLEEAISCKE
jgi:hypothetical protein